MYLLAPQDLGNRQGFLDCYVIPHFRCHLPQLPLSWLQQHRIATMDESQQEKIAQFASVTGADPTVVRLRPRPFINPSY